MRYGGRVEVRDGRVHALRDRHGHLIAALDWDGDRARARVPRAPWRDTGPDQPAREPGADDVIVDAGTAPHPVLGSVHEIRSAGRVLARVSAIDWRAPRVIPAIDEPAAIPAGTGAVLLDLIALAARHGDVDALSYHGPYPTRALWRSLATCFTCAGDEDAFAGGAPLAFVPRPFERHWCAPDVAVDLRDDLERARVDGRSYGGAGPHRLARAGDDVIAALWIGDAPIAIAAVFAPDGTLRAPPTAPPPWRSPVLGQRFPAPLVAAIAELCAQTAAPALAGAIGDELATRGLMWADTGLDLTRAGEGPIALHAALWDRLAPHGLPRVALALAEALSPLVRELAQRRLAARWAP